MILSILGTILIICWRAFVDFGRVFAGFGRNLINAGAL